MQLTDVTIREAAQMPGRSYSKEQRIDAGLAIDRLGVAQIETGFPIAGEVEREVTSELASQVDANTVAIARALERDVNAALEANADVIEVFAPVSDLHLEYDLGKSREEVLDMIETAVSLARDGGADVRVGLLDGFRTDVTHLRTVCERFPDVSRIGLADTVGCRTPETVRDILDQLTDVIDPNRLSVHFHNDLGCGVANVLAAYERGVGNADVAIGALGERVGNPALEELVIAADKNHDERFGVNASILIPIATEVLEILEEEISPRKPILGTEATRHEAGLHTAVMLEEPSAFEPFDPSQYGGSRTLVFGEGTGRGGAQKLLEQAGIEPSEETVSEFLQLLAEHGPLDQDAATSRALEEFDHQDH